jgi:hypothetical protein
MKNAVFWDVTRGGFYNNGCFGGTCLSVIMVKRIGELGTTLALTSNYTLLVAANVVPNSLILFTLMVEEIHSSEMSVVTSTTRRHIPEGGIFR